MRNDRMELVTRDDLRDRSRSIRKDRRVYFFDCAAAYDETGGAQLENLVALQPVEVRSISKGRGRRELGDFLPSR